MPQTGSRDATFRRLRKVEAFFVGFGSVWSVYPSIDIPEAPVRFFHSDEEALASDWHAVGSDMLFALQKTDESLHGQKE
jgi:hypothetical protein